MKQEYLINNGQISKIHVLIGQLGFAGDKDFKAVLVKEYSNQRETSTKGLTWKEAQDMINALSKLAASKIIADVPEKDLQVNRKRRLILHYAHQMGWERSDRKVDMERVNAWCVKFGQYHKELNAHNVIELSHLIAQFEKVFKAFLKSV